MTPEGVFKRKLILEIQKLFPGAIILKNDAGMLQGFPDHLILWGPHWAAFEAKRSRHAHIQPNQKYYVDKLNQMSLAMFVYPENKEDFLYELQQAFRPNGSTRVLRRE